MGMARERWATPAPSGGCGAPSRPDPSRSVHSAGVQSRLGSREAMSAAVQDLVELRHRVLDDYVDGRITDQAERSDLAAIAIELDRLLSQGGGRPIELNGDGGKV